MGDMSPLCKAAISGPDAARFVDMLIPRRTDNFAVGQIYYTPWCSDDGKVVSDGLVYRVDEASYRFTGDPTCDWFRQKSADYDVEIADETDDYGILMVQGPRSQQVVESASGQGWSELDFSRRADAMIGGVDVELARQGFTGELGWELHHPMEMQNYLFDRLMEAGEAHGLKPVGARAQNWLRQEKSYRAFGTDLGRDATPLEAGLDRFVDLSKDFHGKDAMEAAGATEIEQPERDHPEPAPEAQDRPASGGGRSRRSRTAGRILRRGGTIQPRPDLPS